MNITTQTPPRAVILAGGEGIRLRPLTRLICGDSRPKQFCPLFGGETLLKRTRTRLRKAIAPEHTFFAVTRSHRRYYARELADVERRRILAQPENKGTAPAIAYGALRVLHDDRNALVAFIPADHYYDDDQPFVDALDQGFTTAARNPDSVVLLGAEPDRAETEYGWIEPADAPGDSKAVACFWEKPAPGHATDLLRRGCLWNTFVMVGRAAAFRNLLHFAVPGLLSRFESALDGKPALEPDLARHLYRGFPCIDFSHQVLALSTERLLVVKLAGTSWSDLGKPERVMETFERAGIRPQWDSAPLHSKKAIA